jgi:hypothetical protein
LSIGIEGTFLKNAAVLEKRLNSSFLMSHVYPGIGKIGLKAEPFVIPTPEEMGISHLMPKMRVKKEETKSQPDQDDCMEDELGKLIEGDEWLEVVCDDDEDEIGLISGMM